MVATSSDFPRFNFRLVLFSHCSSLQIGFRWEHGSVRQSVDPPIWSKLIDLMDCHDIFFFYRHSCLPQDGL